MSWLGWTRRKMLLVALPAVLVTAVTLYAVRDGSGESGKTNAGKTPVVEVTVKDFVVTVPSEMPAGDVAIRVKNEGPVDHEFLVIRAGDSDMPLRGDGLTVDEELLEPQTAGIIEAWPAGSVRLLRVNLRPGTYHLFCNMSGHYRGGMKAQVVVKR